MEILADSSVEPNEGQSPVEHQAVVAHYEAAVPRMLAIFGQIPLLWATAANGLANKPVYHAQLDVGPATIPTIEFTTPSGATHRAPCLSLHNCEWLVRGRFAVSLGSWTPTINDPETAGYGRIHLEPSGRATPAELSDAALAVRAALLECNLDAIPVYDGIASLTLWIPLAGAPAYAVLYAWLKTFCDDLITKFPSQFTSAHLRAERGDRMYLAIHSNGVGQIALLPYSLVCAPQLPVQWPQAWPALQEAQPQGVSATSFALALSEQGEIFSARASELSGQKLPATSNKSISVALLLDSAVPPPHGYLTAAAITILSDGKTRTVDEILAAGIAAKLLPEDLPRKYLYTALHEYITRALGTGSFPEFTQLDDVHFRINRPADDWPPVALVPLTDWLDPAARTTLSDRLRTSSVGEDPTAFEVAVCDAFAALGFVATHVGGSGQPDGILEAPLGRAGYRVIVECKTAHADAPVANPRPEEPAAFRDREGGQYALLIGPQFSNDRTFNDELQAHGTALWTVDDLITALNNAIGPDEITAAFAAGHAVTVIDAILWERDHGARKRITYVAGLIARCAWQAQVRCGPAIAVTDRPQLTRDALMLIVDQALADLGLQTGVTTIEFNAALEMAEVNGTIRRITDGNQENWLARYPLHSEV